MVDVGNYPGARDCMGLKQIPKAVALLKVASKGNGQTWV